VLRFNSASVRVADDSRAVDGCISIMYGNEEPEKGGGCGSSTLSLDINWKKSRRRSARESPALRWWAVPAEELSDVKALGKR
jgi:hypothetical protein